MSEIASEKRIAGAHEELLSYADRSGKARCVLTEAAAWVSDRHLGFWVISIGMIVMLLWAGAF